MIQLKNINKYFGKRHVLKDITLDIEDNAAIAFIGSNGSGKTTLVEIIAKLLKPTQGSIHYTSDKEAKDVNRRVGMQFQDGSWPPGTKIIDLVKFYKDKSFINSDEFNQLVDAFNLKDFINKSIDSLSGGERQRANCFLSIINNPEILILDELITGLDLEMQIKLIKFFKEYKKNNKVALLIVSHIPEEVEELCDRVVILKSGEIYEDSDMKTIIEKHGSLRKRLLKYYEIQE
ncbi:ABC transporter ATP-binding protein [Spiroplasma helicoides]|uniref:ABC transporter ATP-binding protein n=1 Tax=Spiroplasma helicoides TaxID=216938 RepID=A0A1B3SM21_9MOLU|nr:ABC transporter ATP-binding protein [Spiroplasma helicoides]AOG60978.1 ABC transporter ATP-binding protein [Spiroplasma helicoides]